MIGRPKGIESHMKGVILVPKITISCPNCKKEFKKYPSEKKVHCSKSCSRKGVKRPLHSIIMKEKHKQKSFGYKTGCLLRDKNPSWKGGVTYEYRLFRKSRDYQKWRKVVLFRDNYRCVFCGTKNKPLHVDHIKQYAYYPELRLSIDNGRTLCLECHKKTETWARRTL